MGRCTNERTSKAHMASGWVGLSEDEWTFVTVDDAETEIRRVRSGERERDSKLSWMLPAILLLAVL